MNHVFNRHLSTKLSIGLLLLAIPIFVLALGILFIKSSDNIRKEAASHAESVLNTAMQHLERHLNAVVTATDINAPEVMANLNPEKVLALTNGILRMNSHVDGCSVSMEPNVFPKYGRYFSAYSIREGDSIVTVVEEQYEYFQKEWYKKPHDQGKACWVDFYDETDSLEVTLNGMIASYCKPLYDSSKKLVAVISTDLSLLRLSRLVSAAKPYPHSYFIMLGEEGRYLLHPDSTQLFHKTIFSDADPQVHADKIALGHDMLAGHGGSMAAVIDSVPSLVCYQPVPGTPWSLALVCPDDDIMGGYHQLAKIVVIVLVIGLMIILLLGNRAVAHAIRPLNQLLTKTQSIIEGNMEVHIPKSRRQDAVGQLQNSFATMLQSLNFHMGSTRYAAEQAQQRINELAEATRQVEEADKRKTTFIQNVTHQIRTPLNIIMGFAQVLSDSSGMAGGEQDGKLKLSEEEMKGIADTMSHNSILLNRLVLMLFDSSESGLTEELQEASNIETVSCNDVAREAVGYVQMHYPQMPMIFDTQLADDFTIQTSRLYLMRSLREILYNAAKYSDGQHVSMHVERTETMVRFIIEDTGSGIAENDRDLMFEAFTKVNDLSEGLGLGLPLSKRHIVNLGGDLKLDGSYHDGCRFIVELPLH